MVERVLGKDEVASSILATAIIPSRKLYIAERMKRVMRALRYPTVDKIVEYNELALHFLKAKKGDKAEVLSHSKIKRAIDDCISAPGEVYDKATALLRGLIQAHAFASGNRRTAFIVTKDFLLSNGAKMGVADDPSHAGVLRGIRERFYTDEEIKEWIQHGKIREFQR